MRSVILWILAAAFAIPLVLWMYLTIGGLVAHWWLPRRIKRASDGGNTPDSFDRASMKEESIIVGVFWPITFPYFFAAWSWIGRSITRFVLWAWAFSTKKPKLPKAEVRLRKHQM